MLRYTYIASFVLFDSTRAEETVQAAAGRVGSFPARSQISVHTGCDANPFSLSNG